MTGHRGWMWKLILSSTLFVTIHLLTFCYFHFVRPEGFVSRLQSALKEESVETPLHVVYENTKPAPFTFSADARTTEPSDDTSPHSYSYDINQPDLCHSLIPDVLIMVITAPTHFNQRRVIRETWGNASLRHGFKLAFLLGRPTNATLQTNIISENNIHQDIIQGSFEDMYRNLALKSVMMVRWASTFCPGVSFLLKIDDDMLFNVWDFVSSLRERRAVNRTIWGLLAKNWGVIRSPESKWCVSNRTYVNATFPDFLTGPSYLMSGDSVPPLALSSASVPYLFLEDVFLTGIVAEKAGVHRVHDGAFLNYRANSFVPCKKPRIITSHGYTPSELKKAWRFLLGNVNEKGCGIS